MYTYISNIQCYYNLGSQYNKYPRAPPRRIKANSANIRPASTPRQSTN